MTEESFQQGRKLMQTANAIRGDITTAKGEVAKWSNIEHSYREQLKPTQADGAKKMLDKAVKKLDIARDKFAALKFPDSDIKKAIIPKDCPGCGSPMAIGRNLCGACDADEKDARRRY